MEGFVEADFDGGEVVVAAAQGEVFAGEMRVGGGEEGEDLAGGMEIWWLSWVSSGGMAMLWKAVRASGEEVVGGEAGAGAVGLPLVAEEAGVGVDVAVLGGVAGAGGVGAVLGVGAVEVLGPEAVEDEGGVLGALGGVGMGVAELG